MSFQKLLAVVINIFNILNMKTLHVSYYLKCEWKVGAETGAVCALVSAWNTFLNPLSTDCILFHFIISALPHLLLFFSNHWTNKNSAPGFAAQNLPNGYPRYPSFGDASSHPSSRHPSVGSARLPSVGEESTHPLLVAEEQVCAPVEKYCVGSECYCANNT